jgi:hypothetical protein
MRIDGLSVYDKNNRIDWKWQAMDGVISCCTYTDRLHF